LRSPPGGRPLGSKDRVPRFSKRADALNKLRQMVREAQDAEHLVTNEKLEFRGTAMEFIQSVYRCERLDARTRLYAAAKAIEYEPRVVAEAQGHREELEQKFEEMVDQWFRATMNETLCQFQGGKPGSSGAAGWIVDMVRERLKDGTAPEAHPSEIIVPSQPPVVVRKRNPATIDGSDCGLADENPENTSVSAGSGRKSVRHQHQRSNRNRRTT